MGSLDDRRVKFVKYVHYRQDISEDEKRTLLYLASIADENGDAVIGDEYGHEIVYHIPGF